MNRTKKMKSEARRIQSSPGHVLSNQTLVRAIARSYNRSLRIILSTPRSLFPFPVWSKVVRRVALALADEAIRSYERGNCREGRRLLGIVETMAGGIRASVARAQRARIELVPNKRDEARRDQTAAATGHACDVTMPREGRDREQRQVEGLPISPTFGGATWSYQQASAPALHQSKRATTWGGGWPGPSECKLTTTWVPTSRFCWRPAVSLRAFLSPIGDALPLR